MLYNMGPCVVIRRKWLYISTCLVVDALLEHMKGGEIWLKCLEVPSQSVVGAQLANRLVAYILILSTCLLCQSVLSMLYHVPAHRPALIIGMRSAQMTRFCNGGS